MCTDVDDAGAVSVECEEGLQCQVASVDQAQEPDALVCKAPCSVDDECTGGETCVAIPLQGEPNIEDDGAGGQARCDDDVSACEDGDDAACPCTLSDGFVCTQFNITDGGGSGFFCNLPLRNCGTAIDTLLGADVANAADPDFRCNVVDESRYCAGGDGGNVQCVTGAESNDGFCFALCSVPAFDANANDIIDAGEEGTQLECGEGRECRTEVAGALGVALVPAAGGACDVAACPAGTRCAACGVGDMECLNLNGGICAAPFGSCELDDGIPNEGEGEGEGEGEPPPAEGCTCNGTTSSSGALFAFALLALRVRRRQRIAQQVSHAATTRRRAPKASSAQKPRKL